MSILNDLTLGRFVPGDSFLHRLDPRVKLAGVPLLIIAVFSGGDALRLGVLGGIAVGLILLSGIRWSLWLRGVRALRWLLLFTLLIHLFFSPGRTLLGVAWLSLDGLIHGTTVSLQLCLAVLFSSLLTLVTSPREIAGAFVSLGAPLRRLGVRVEEGAGLLLLVLHFLPILKEETLAASAATNSDPSRSAPPLSAARFRAMRLMIAPLILRLVDRADALAQASARGDDDFQRHARLGPLRRTSDRLAAGLGGTALLLVFLI